MSRVYLAKSAGFCFGVSRSVDMAEKLLESGPCKSLGPLIHNEDVVSELARRGLQVISDPSEARPGDRVMIRSHGVSKAVEDALRAAGDDTVLLQLKGPLNPVVVSPLEGDKYTYLVLPVRLKAND